jgi:nitrate reductase (NAD(P)H)
MTTGEDIDVRGPSGEIEYRGKGTFMISDNEYHFEKVSLVDELGR